MKIFEVVLKGYNGATDRTDHLILWIKASSMDKVTKCFDNAQEIYEIKVHDELSLDLEID